MATRDITRDMRNEIALNIQDITSDTTTVGNIFDMKDFDGGINITLFSGAVAAGTFDVLVEHGDDSLLADASAVADSELLGQDPASSVAPELQAQITASNAIKKIGVVSPKAFGRISVVSTGASGNNILGAIVEKKPEIKPAEIVS